MRIALTHAFSWPEVRRGAERFVPALGAALVRRGHEVVHYSAAWEPGRALEDGVRTVRVPRQFDDTYRHEADFARRLLPALIRERFDAVHSLGRWDAVTSITAARLRRDGRTTVITDLGLPDRSWWRQQGCVQAAAALAVTRWIDVYSAMSRTAVTALADAYGRSDGVVVPGGVDMDRFRPAASRSPAPAILFSGAITERRKGVPVLLEALPLIARGEPEVELWLSGPGDPAELLRDTPDATRERVRALGLGDSERQHERYGSAWITCLPSVNDSFGMALLESLACGTPLVTTTDGAPKELVAEHVTGELCAPHDPRSLADACLRAFELARDPGTIEACRRAAAPYDWDRGLAPLCERLYQGHRD
ncbi:MAG TPA: glycosyltransferase family 4 protein [Solirubrobacteraceae bacterium]|nr:glycosyltransferase family 4 protein [Solirubrobacteraceae bacterium]